HLLQGLLHVLDVAGAVLDQLGALTQVVAQDGDVGGGAEGARQQAVGVQALDPLAVELVGLGPALDATGGAGGHQDDVGAAAFEGGGEGLRVGAGGVRGPGGGAPHRAPGGGGGGAVGRGAERSGLGSAGG